MIKRMILMLILTGAIIAALGLLKFQQIQKAIAQGAAFQPPPEAVTTIVARQERWPTHLSAIGTMAAVQGVTVSADLPGIVDRIAFESGTPVNAGDVLVELDTRQEQAQLAAAEAERDLARLNFDRLEGLVNQRAIARTDYDRAAAEQKRTEAKVGEIRATIARKTIRAPFSGILGIRQVNLGQYMSPGDPVVPLQSLDPIYVNFGVPQQDAGQVRIGRAVRITTGDVAGVVFFGKRDSHQLGRGRGDPQYPGPGDGGESERHAATRHVRRGGGQAGREPAGRVAAGLCDQLCAVRRLGLCRHRSQGSRRVRPTAVCASSSSSLARARGDQIAVVSGLKPGEEVVTSGVFKLRNGAAVLVNNKVQPANERAPKPEDS